MGTRIISTMTVTAAMTISDCLKVLFESFIVTGQFLLIYQDSKVRHAPKSVII